MEVSEIAGTLGYANQRLHARFPVVGAAPCPPLGAKTKATDPAERLYFKQVKTSLQLPKEQIDEVREVACSSIACLKPQADGSTELHLTPLVLIEAALGLGGRVDPDRRA
jgi:hypothetical protein